MRLKRQTPMQPYFVKVKYVRERVLRIAAGDEQEAADKALEIVGILGGVISTEVISVDGEPEE